MAGFDVSTPSIEKTFDSPARRQLPDLPHPRSRKSQLPDPQEAESTGDAPESIEDSLHHNLDVTV